MKKKHVDAASSRVPITPAGMSAESTRLEAASTLYAYRPYARTAWSIAP